MYLLLNKNTGQTVVGFDNLPPYLCSSERCDELDSQAYQDLLQQWQKSEVFLVKGNDVSRLSRPFTHQLDSLS
jgi:hypothetical protein